MSTHTVYLTEVRKTVRCFLYDGALSLSTVSVYTTPVGDRITGHTNTIKKPTENAN